MLQSVKVKDYMSGNLTTFAPDMDVMIAVTSLIKNRISGAPVVDSHGNLVGILSEKDCMKVAIQTCYYSGQVGLVSDYMQSPVETVEGEMSIVELAEKFTETSYRRFPVVENNRLIGQISVRDVLRALEQISAPEAFEKIKI